MSPLTINHLQEMDWKRFEELCHKYFQFKGYDSRLTGAGADGGVDVVLERSSPEGRPVKIYVQCKAWSNQKVGVKAVRELYGVMAGDQVPIGIFVTASDFTGDAKSFAKGKKLQLISGERLLSLISQLSVEQQKELVNSALAGDYTTPTCPKCGVRMVLRTVSKGKNTGDQFWGCRNFPSCCQKLHLKRSHAKEKVKDDFFHRFFDIPESRSANTAGFNSRNGAFKSSEAWAADSRASKSSRTKGYGRSLTKNKNKVFLVSIVFSVVLIAVLVKAVSLVFTWFGESTLDHATKVQQQAQRAYAEKSNTPPSKLEILPAQKPQTDPYDEQVRSLGQQATLAFERESSLERRKTKELEKVKEQAWVDWYKVPWGCDNWDSVKHMVGCVNHKSSEKERFDLLWAEGRINPSRG
ncbi:restriction endonuclease [Endozoicomonas sp.]|uniref:restriction endonuclease n=1 Tax=Endozoicomonas sp. TaxID=1892382 RepID=UPI002887D168|nr:restriction endonuclease [Endozoicomonas sp.]